MKLLKLCTLILVVGVANMLQAQELTITVTVPNVTSNTGHVNYALYKEAGFLKEPIQTKSSVITEKKSTVTFEKVAPGEYAIVCYHDKNENQRMDFQPNGMPLESYGATNNVMNYGPPQYDQAKFVITDKDVSLEIRF